MKYYIFTLVISSFIFSCTSSNQKHFNEDEKAIDNVEEDTHVSDIEDEHYPIDSIELYNLIPKRAIIKDVFDKAIVFLTNEKYICILMSTITSILLYLSATIRIRYVMSDMINSDF